MPLTIDIDGRQTITYDEPASSPVGRRFTRREPLDDPSDNVEIVGVFDVGNADIGVQLELVIRSLTFGAAVDQDGRTTTTVDAGDFAEEFRPIESDEVSSHHAREVLGSIDDTKAAEEANAAGETATWRLYR